MTADLRVVRAAMGWLNDLTLLVRFGDSDRAPTDEQLQKYADLLAISLPSGAFSASSLEHVAARIADWPEYGKLRRLLADHWNENRPHTAPVVTDPDNVADGLSPTDQDWLDFFNKRINEGGNRRHLESLLRAYARPAWHIVRPSPVADDWED